MEANVPLAEAWALWSDQENVVNWMPWIAEVKVLLPFMMLYMFLSWYFVDASLSLDKV